MDQTPPIEPVPTPTPPPPSEPASVVKAGLPGSMDLLKQAIAIFKANHKTYISLGLVIVVIGVVQTILTETPLVFVGGPLGVVAVILQIFLQVGVIKTTVGIETGNVKGVLDTYKAAAPYFWAIIGVSILTALVTMGAALFLIIPAIAVAGFLMFTMFAVVVDEKRGLAALTQSWYVVSENWWPVFGRQLMMVILLFLPIAIAGFIIVAILGAIGGIVGLVLSSAAGSFIYTCIAFPISIIYPYLLYKSLKAQKGEVTPEFTASKKKWLVGLGIIGIIVPLIILGIVLTTLTSLNSSRLQQLQNLQNQTPSDLSASVQELFN